ncbi:hypothetical protein HK105_201542 [Polyrhizophydium stewartii]|uniref:Ska2 N-terminal domain-containing protein n=1 Tax=Polyrhizophydium stewartii TaxID=2732419 RepID=A0ABR4NGP8_9FUNG|nr:hypothetical protein HK105_002027 [Polyrhizophydium stewartii]
MALLSSVNDMHAALSKTAQDLDFVEQQLNYELRQQCGPHDSPVVLFERLDKLEKRIQAVVALRDQVVAEKLLFATQMEQQLATNAQLMERILSATEYEGDYQMLSKFTELSEKLRQSADAAAAQEQQAAQAPDPALQQPQPQQKQQQPKQHKKQPQQQPARRNKRHAGE